MKHLSRRAGTTCLRWLVLASGLGAVAAGTTALAQEKLTRPPTDDQTKFEAFKRGDTPIVIEGNKDATEQNRQVLDRIAKYHVLRLNLPEEQRTGLASVVQEAQRRLQLTAYSRLNAQQKQFNDEFGKALVNHLTNLAVNSGKPVVRLNAVRLAAEIGKTGYDGVAELYLKVLEKENESEGIKLYALEGLHNLFAVMPDPVAAPRKTAFQKKDDGILTPLERKSIQALITYIERKIELPAGAGPAEEEALWFIRREAIRALGHVRVQRVKNLAQVESRPALVLLKVACGDIPSPADKRRNISERIEGLIGFLHLLPDRDRELQVDYAAYHVAKALNEIAVFRVNDMSDRQIPWKATGARLREALDTWRKHVDEEKLTDAVLINNLYLTVEGNILSALEQGLANLPPNAGPLQNWLQARQPKEDASLFKSDKTAVIKAQ